MTIVIAVCKERKRFFLAEPPQVSGPRTAKAGFFGHWRLTTNPPQRTHPAGILQSGGHSAGALPHPQQLRLAGVRVAGPLARTGRNNRQEVLPE